MKWDEYYEKINDWAVSTAVNKISSLENIGASDEVVEALYIISDEDKKGAARLLNRALQQGITFSGENLVEINDICSEESFQKALRQSESKLTAQDLEEMYGCMDDEIIIEIAKKYHIQAPEGLLEDYEEELCTDPSEPISWKSFYDKFYDWDSDFAIARSKALCDFGDGDEVVEVANELFGTNECEAGNFIHQALAHGVCFRTDELSEIASLCDEKTIRDAVMASGSNLDEAALEELYGIVDEDVLIDVAKKQGIRLPEDLREEEPFEDDSDFVEMVQSVMGLADYALDSLVRAQKAMNASGSVSFLDMVSHSFFPSLLKFCALGDAEQELAEAQGALENLNEGLRMLSMNGRIRLEYTRLASAIELWFDSGFMDCLVHLQINKVQKRINKAIRQVEDVKRELKKIT